MRFTKEFSRLVDKDLKDRESLTDAEVQILHADLDGWIDVLKDFKGEIEIQFTHFKKLETEKHLAYIDEEITEHQYLRWKVAQLNNRTRATRFLKSIESKLVYVKYERERQTVKHLSDHSDSERGRDLSTYR